MNEAVHRERLAYEHLYGGQWTLPGCLHLRQLTRAFEIARSDGPSHLCLVHPPLHTSLFSFQKLHGKIRPLPALLAKHITKYVLEALDFLHREANISHCGKSDT